LDVQFSCFFVGNYGWVGVEIGESGWGWFCLVWVCELFYGSGWCCLNFAYVNAAVGLLFWAFLGFLLISLREL
jgi:hypothetical protein